MLYQLIRLACFVRLVRPVRSFNLYLILSSQAYPRRRSLRAKYELFTALFSSVFNEQKKRPAHSISDTKLTCVIIMEFITKCIIFPLPPIETWLWAKLLKECFITNTWPPKTASAGRFSPEFPNHGNDIRRRRPTTHFVSVKSAYGKDGWLSVKKIWLKYGQQSRSPDVDINHLPPIKMAIFSFLFKDLASRYHRQLQSGKQKNWRNIIFTASSLFGNLSLLLIYLILMLSTRCIR